MRFPESFCTLQRVTPLLLALTLLPLPLARAQWTASVGAQSTSMARQALAFLPNEMWIHAGDTVTWTSTTDEPHTITFLTAGQVRPFFAVGCPGFSTNPATFDGSKCVTTNLLPNGQGLTVNFPKAGNYRVACLLHENMQGVVHVVDPSQILPHEQDFYDAEARRERANLLSDDTRAHHHHDGGGVMAGMGEVVVTPGGSQSLSVLRFMRDKVTVHVGDTVEFTNGDPVTPHTITFGPPPQNIVIPSPNVQVGDDGALNVTLLATSDKAHSGFLQASFQDRTGLPQSVPGTTRFRVTFVKPGVYSYVCVLHDNLGMVGTVTVLP